MKMEFFKAAAFVLGVALILYFLSVVVPNEQRKYNQKVNGCEETVIRIHGNLYCFDSDLVQPMDNY